MSHYRCQTTSTKIKVTTAENLSCIRSRFYNPSEVFGSKCGGQGRFPQDRMNTIMDGGRGTERTFISSTTATLVSSLAVSPSDRARPARARWVHAEAAHTRSIMRVDLTFNGLKLKNAVHRSPPFTSHISRTQTPNGRLGLSSKISFNAASTPLAPVR